jgi:hypothetical protein
VGTSNRKGHVDRVIAGLVLANNGQQSEERIQDLNRPVAKAIVKYDDVHKAISFITSNPKLVPQLFHCWIF